MQNSRALIPFGRAPILRKGFDPFSGFKLDFDQFLDDFSRAWPVTTTNGKDGFLIPKVDIAETDAGLELTAELPGFDQKDISLDIQNDILTIKAERHEEHEEKDEKKNYHLVELSQGSFLRRIALPFEADASKALAHLEKGLLKVEVPRLATPEKRPKAIPIITK
ncbi:MAG: hypothetical protein RL425_810 [Pseudomonadota bacterium]